MDGQALAADVDRPLFKRMNRGVSLTAASRLGECILALEMAVEEALRHASRRDDLLDAGCVIAVAMDAARPA